MVRFLFDYDSTLADTTSARIAAINEEFGTEYTVDGITSWHNSDSGYMDPDCDEWSWGPECFLSEKFQAEMPPVPYAIEGVHRLLTQGHEGMVVSDRPPMLFEVTRNWLDRQGLEMVRLLFTRHKASKSGEHKGFTKKQAAYLYKLKQVIEDAPHHSMDLAQKDYIEKVYLLDTPYNQGVEHEKIIRVPDWRSIQ